MPRLADVWGLFAWVFGVCMLAGAASVYRRYRKRTRFTTFEIFGEMFLSGFVGLMTFLAAIGIGLMQIPPHDFARACLVSFLCGIAAHMSTRILAIYEDATARRVRKLLGEPDGDNGNGDKGDSDAAA